MPVKTIQFQKRHQIQQTQDTFHFVIMSGTVEMLPSPVESWSINYFSTWKQRIVGFPHLLQTDKSIKKSYVLRCTDFYVFSFDCKFISFFPKFLLDFFKTYRYATVTNYFLISVSFKKRFESKDNFTLFFCNII